MKKQAIIAIVLLFTTVTPLFAAQSATPSAAVKSASSSATPKSAIAQEDKIKSLKERLATKVAEIRENQKGVVWGTIKQSRNTELTLVTNKEDVIVVFNEDDTIIKEITTGKLTETTIKAIKPNLHATIFGLIDAQEKKVDAKYILLKSQSIAVVGIVTEKDAAANTVNVKTVTNELYIVDVEATTRINTFSGDKITKSGFSKISEGDRVHIRGVPQTSGDEKKIQATSALHIPSTFFKPIPTASPESSPSASPEEAE